MAIVRNICSFISSLVIAVVLALLISIFVIQPYKVEGHSMDPTLHDQERIFVSKLPHTMKSIPQYGDIVIIDSRVDRNRSFKDDVLESPMFQLMLGTTDNFFYVKRVIGKPGDILEFKDHKVYRNGVALNEPYIKETMNYYSDRKWVVPANHIFVMGDNRNNSNDSRTIGFIPLDHDMGKKIL